MDVEQTFLGISGGKKLGLTFAECITSFVHSQTSGLKNLQSSMSSIF